MKEKYVVWGTIPLLAIALSMFTAFFCFNFGNYELGVVFFSYFIILLQSRIVFRRLLSKAGLPIFLLPLIRCSFYFFPLFFLRIPLISYMDTWGVIVGIFIGIILLLICFSELKLNLSSDYLELLPSLSIAQKVERGFLIGLSAIAQEFFYRGAVLSVFLTFLSYGAVAVSAFFFGIEHILHFNAREQFDTKDYILQLALGVLLGILYYFTGSLLGCMTGHLLYNMPGIIQIIRQKTSRI